MDKNHPRSVGEKDKVIGERIRTHRLIQGLSQDELGSKIGVSFQQVQKYEKGTNRVSSIRLSEIAEALGTNIMTLVDGTDGGCAKCVRELFGDVPPRSSKRSLATPCTRPKSECAAGC